MLPQRPSHNRRSVSHFRYSGPQIPQIKIVVMTCTSEFGNEGPNPPAPGHAVWPADSLLVVAKPAQIAM